MPQPTTGAEGAADNARQWPALVRRLIRKFIHPYRPERHYMRGGRFAGDRRHDAASRRPEPRH
jgi:hypothetical protein